MHLQIVTRQVHKHASLKISTLHIDENDLIKKQEKKHKSKLTMNKHIIYRHFLFYFNFVGAIKMSSYSLINVKRKKEITLFNV